MYACVYVCVWVSVCACMGLMCRGVRTVQRNVPWTEIVWGKETHENGVAILARRGPANSDMMMTAGQGKARVK
ncbi:hypothetical protein CSPX01_10264 [Colletotrichum filicis]|nr:hypothetical protein CSPX01_10264 [Colletotrichum filicis]